MSDLILYIVKQLVTNPDAVSVEEQNSGGEVNLLLTVDPVDMGLIIGKNGQTIKAIRKVLIVKAMADNVRVNLQLAEPAGGRPEKPASQQISESAEVSESVDQQASTETPQKAEKLKKRSTKKVADADITDSPETAEVPTDDAGTPEPSPQESDSEPGK